jgi:hypothetical protein
LQFGVRQGRRDESLRHSNCPISITVHLAYVSQ